MAKISCVRVMRDEERTLSADFDDISLVENDTLFPQSSIIMHRAIRARIFKSDNLLSCIGFELSYKTNEKS